MTWILVVTHTHTHKHNTYIRCVCVCISKLHCILYLFIVRKRFDLNFELEKVSMKCKRMNEKFQSNVM